MKTSLDYRNQYREAAEKHNNLTAETVAKADAEGRAFTPDEVAALGKTKEAMQVALSYVEQLAGSGEVPAEETNSVNEPRSRKIDPVEINNSPVCNPKDFRKYSILKAIRETSTNGLHLTGLEAEVNQEMTKRNGKASQGFWFPTNMPFDRPEKRAVSTTTYASFVETNTTTDFIELLRNKSVIFGLGAKQLNGLVGVVSIPKMSSAATAYWVSEGNSPTGSASGATTPVTLTPSTIGVTTEIYRKTLMQSSQDIENLVRDDMALVLALGIDSAVINGSGTPPEPQGILGNSGVPTVTLGTNGGVPTFAKMVELETTVAAANAELGNLAYLTSAQGRGKLKTTVKESTHPVYLWENNEVNGYKAVASNQVPSDLTKASGSNLSAIIYGNFADILVGFWSGVDVIADPYTGSAGGIKLTLLQDTAVALRHAVSFAKILDMTT